jgi:16S rRNA (guanine527-N7)-methyltransferase
MTGTNVVPSPPAVEGPAPVDPPFDEIPDDLLEVATRTFGPSLATARRYAYELCTTAIERGVIGPREAPRIWERHLLNCAVVVDLLPPDCNLIDVGSGAGLPGIPLALARLDVRVTLLDSLARRISYLNDLISTLDLAPRVRTVLARAEEHVHRYDVVTARAVAPLEKLGRWTAHLVPPGGLLVAIRGEQGVAELAAARPALNRAGWVETRVVSCGATLPVPTTVVVGVRR